MTSSTTLARQAALHIAARLDQDPTYRFQVERDPLATLTSAGLPAERVSDFLFEAGIEPELMGYARCTESCWISCLITCRITSQAV